MLVELTQKKNRHLLAEFQRIAKLQEGSGIQEWGLIPQRSRGSNNGSRGSNDGCVFQISRFRRKLGGRLDYVQIVSCDCHDDDGSAT